MKSHSALKALSIAMIAVLLTGCASDITSEHVLSHDKGRVVPGKALPAPVKRKAAVGEEMLTAGEYALTSRKLARKIAVMQAGASADIKHKLRSFNFNLAPATLTLEGTIKSGYLYQYPRGFMTASNEPAYGGLIAPYDNPELATKIYWNWISSSTSSYYTADLDQPIKLATSEIEEEISGSTAYQTPLQVLIYSGVSAGQIRFVYKEFTPSGLTRPSFTQDVVLDYQEGEEYAFKNARFIINKAGPAFVEFTVITGL